MASTLNNTMKLETVGLSEDRLNGSRKKESFHRQVARQHNMAFWHLTMFSFSLKSTH